MAFRIYNPQGKMIDACDRIDLDCFYLSLSSIGLPELRVFRKPNVAGGPSEDLTIKFFPQHNGNGVYPSVENIAQVLVMAPLI